MSIPSDGALRRPGPKLPPLILTEQERETLQRWSRRAKSSQALALRSRIVLACAGPEPPAIVQVATQMGITPGHGAQVAASFPGRPAGRSGR